MMKPSICYMWGINTTQNSELFKVETCEECVCSSRLPLIFNPLILSFWNDAHMHITKPPHPPNLPPRPHTSSRSLKDFWWPRGKLLGVQVEFRRRPASLSLSSPRLSRHMKISHGFLLTWDQPGSSKPPGMAVVIPSPVPRALCLIKWAAVSTDDIGLTYV